jgi:hypothetical protein
LYVQQDEKAIFLISLPEPHCAVLPPSTSYR